jgi:acyl-coenzyme A synthetase/AMP-(fatty) acid ligase
VRRPGLALEQETLAAFAATRLAGFKKPRRIEFVAALPRNAANKVQISLLKERLSKEETKWRIEDHSRASG